MSPYLGSSHMVSDNPDFVGAAAVMVNSCLVFDGKILDNGVRLAPNKPGTRYIAKEKEATARSILRTGILEISLSFGNLNLPSRYTPSVINIAIQMDKKISLLSIFKLYSL